MIENLDILLDPFYFGMVNTFYDAMAVNIPVVTMPTKHMKSRFALAAYKQMDIKNPPIAESPDENEIASSPFSNEHIFSSKLVRVGFPALE